MKRFLFTAVLLVVYAQIFSQSATHIATGTRPLSDVPQVLLPQQDNKALLEEELALREPGRPIHFATPLDVDIRPEEQGLWETAANGNAVWRLRIKSPSALSLNLGFTRYWMPSAGTLLLYSPDQKRVIGPFAAEDNETHRQLWTPVLHGEELVIEVQLPPAQRPLLDLELKHVQHDFIGFGILNSASGSCNLDVICGAADGWAVVDSFRDIIQSGAAYHVNGFSTCSGALINNARNDCTPYFLTADHCGISTNNAPSVVVYFNYQNSFCRQPNSSQSGQPGNGMLNQFNSGAIFRAGYGPSDFTLIELDDPLDPQHNPFLAGWNREKVVATRGIAVHHPGVEEKRISFDNDPLNISGWIQPTDSTHVEVNDWDIGTTEGGSSGSPLFDQNKRIIGQLTGGGAACGNNLSDLYGWMHVNWTGGGTPNTRLSDWLDPDNTGVQQLDGKSCAFTIVVSPLIVEVCNTQTTSQDFQIIASDGWSGNVTLAAGNVPAGANAAFAMNPIAPGDTTTLTLSNLGSVATGTYQVGISATDGVEADSATIALTIVTAAPGTATLNLPANNATGLTIFPIYEWAPTSGVFDIEIATDSLFANIVDQATGVSGNTYTGAQLASQTEHWWRVREINACGPGNWSSIFRFTTDEIVCLEVSADNLPLFIQSGPPNTVNANIPVPFGGTIVDVNASRIEGIHTWVGDLKFTLISPLGTQVVLLDQICGNEDDFDIGFDDQASAQPPCPYNVGGSYTPQDALSAFNGQNSMGNWTLQIDDLASIDGGTVRQVDIRICVASFISGVESAQADDFRLYPNPSEGRIHLSRVQAQPEAATVRILNGAGQIVGTTNWPAQQADMDMDLSELPAGFYMVHYTNGHSKRTRKLILTH